jgi:hypothetical protein
VNEFWRKLCDITLTDNPVTKFADPTRKIVGVDNYTYTVDGNTLSADITATASQTFPIIMDSDSDFVCFYFSGYARATGGSVMILNPAVLVQITDKSSGRTFFNRPAPMPLMAGQGGFPFLLNSPRVIKPRTTLEVTAISAQVQSFSGFYFCLHGSRIYYA